MYRNRNRIPRLGDLGEVSLMRRLGEACSTAPDVWIPSGNDRPGTGTTVPHEEGGAPPLVWSCPDVGGGDGGGSDQFSDIACPPTTFEAPTTPEEELQSMGLDTPAVFGGGTPAPGAKPAAKKKASGGIPLWAIALGVGVAAYIGYEVLT